LGRDRVMKSLEVRIHEAAALIKELEKALALQRDVGTPLSSGAYIALRHDARIWLHQNGMS